MAATPLADLARAAETEGILYFNLSFVGADAQGRPTWCGDPARAVDGGAFDRALRDQIAHVRALGGDVAVSFGGPQGPSLAEAITRVADLAEAYRSVIDAYGLARVDFDLTGTALDDQAAIERSWRAIARLQQDYAAAGRPLAVWITLPATSAGLSERGQNAVRSALEHGVVVDGVNLKLDGTGEEADQLTHGKAGRNAVEAALHGYYQLRRTLQPDETIGDAWLRIGITPQLGGSTGGRFGPADARELYGFAELQGIGMISTWSRARSETSAAGAEPATPDAERASEISEIFRSFTDLLPR
jgi:hypothetical protein